jgi:hypothetical protein
MLIAYALYVSRADKIIGTTSALLVAIAVGLLGPILYWATAILPSRGQPPAIPANNEGL